MQIWDYIAIAMHNTNMVHEKPTLAMCHPNTFFCVMQITLLDLQISLMVIMYEKHHLVLFHNVSSKLSGQ